MSSEQLIASAKSGLTTVRISLMRSPSSWQSYIGSVRTCVNYVDQSRIMASPSRLEERLWIIKEVQDFAYYDSDNGGIPELASWCEREWNRVLSTYPSHVGALKGCTPTSPSPPKFQI
jgi:hypothetical protein